MGFLTRLGFVSRPGLVRVASRDLTAPVPPADGHGYVYRWTLDADPMPGMRVMVPGADGQAPAVVLGVAAKHEAAGLQLKSVSRVVTGDEIQRAHERVQADTVAWLRMARKAAGLPGAGRVRTSPPEGFPAIPPTSGEARKAEADRYGRTWYRIAKKAEELERDPDEVAAFRSNAHRWFAIRDRQ